MLYTLIVGQTTILHFFHLNMEIIELALRQLGGHPLKGPLAKNIFPGSRKIASFLLQTNKLLFYHRDPRLVKYSVAVSANKLCTLGVCSR